jgi:TetR/AcrR family transcriptional regulator, transcriptional repressor of aconitase
MTKKSVQTKEQILKAANECFKQFGYSKTTFGDIAKIAGVSRALIYSYFKNKSDVFVTITQNEHDSYRNMSEEILKSDSSDDERLSKIINVWIVDPYRDLRNSNYGNELLDGLVNISEQSEKRFKKLFIKSIEPIVGEDVAELIVLSIRGLLDDRPPVKTLQKRIALLITKIA